MDFRAIIPISKVSTSIIYHSGIVSLGSCLAVDMDEKFAYYKFPITLSPSDILFHPFAIENIITWALQSIPYVAEDFFLHSELWHSFDFHPDMSHISLKESISLANRQQILLCDALHRTSLCFLTLDTAWVYIYNSTDRTAASCRKLPQQHFSKRLLSMEKIGESLTCIAQSLKQINPSIHLVITISPMWHIRDGLSEDQVSKSQLFSVLYPLITSSYYTYFPAYELLLDELRDYRFCANDMVHPSEITINYMWERLVTGYIDTATQMDMKRTKSVQKAFLHRPFDPDTEKHQQFSIQLQQKIEVFTMKYPHIGFQEVELR